MNADGAPHAYDLAEGFAKVAIVQLTLTCPLECAHCITHSSPKRRETLSETALLSLLDEIGADNRIEMVIFTGGEPFAAKRLLQTAVKRVHAHELRTGVVTSASWARTEERARAVLWELAGATPIHLSLSADRFHTPFVPLQNIRHAATAGIALGHEVGIFLCLVNDDDPFERQFLAELGPLASRVRIERHHLGIGGRAAQQPGLCEQVAHVDFAALPAVACSQPAAPLVRADGAVMACCGETATPSLAWPALTLGHAGTDRVDSMLDAADGDFLIQGLRTMGPKELLRQALARAGKEAPKRLFERHNICDVCREATNVPDNLRLVREYLADPRVQEQIILARAVQRGEAMPVPR